MITKREQHILSKMKIKVPCKVCEMSLDHQKLTREECTHTSFLSPLGQVPSVVPPLGLGVQNQIVPLPQLREIMLAAYRAAYYLSGEFVQKKSLLALKISDSMRFPRTHRWITYFR